ncbi:MAG: EVE domain-containing protein [Gammaproteobacteria bacterium]|nr:EVE domain-containing protein [Gammaproteobacteria bacterium]
MKYWIMKSEPDVFGIDDLAKRPRKTEHWDGIRNYQVRNMLRDDMQKGDEAFFYHSSCKEPGIAGIIRIVKAAYPDHTAFDPESKYHDPKSDPANPRWLMVDVQLVRKFARVIGLPELRSHPALADLLILRRGNRLSITPISKKHWDYILRLEAKSS